MSYDDPNNPASMDYEYHAVVAGADMIEMLSNINGEKVEAIMSAITEQFPSVAYRITLTMMKGSRRAIEVRVPSSSSFETVKFIKLVREMTGYGLYEAKKLYDKARDEFVVILPEQGHSYNNVRSFRERLSALGVIIR